MAWPPCKSWRDCHTRECVRREAAPAGLDRLPRRVGGRGDGGDRARRADGVGGGGAALPCDRDMVANRKTAAGGGRCIRRVGGGGRAVLVRWGVCRWGGVAVRAERGGSGGGARPSLTVFPAVLVVVVIGVTVTAVPGPELVT